MRKTYRTAVGVVLVLLLSAAGNGLAADTPATWLQWRGPTRDGRVTGPEWPASLEGDRLRQLWRVELGPGYPGPIVTADQVFVAETKDRSDEVVRALDRRSGKPLWQASWKGSLSVPFFARSNGDWIRSTPACDGDSLFVAGMRDVLVCLDVRNGNERWRVDFMERFKTPLPPFGFVCSPLVEGDAVYVQAGAAFVKLNKRTGETLWRALKDDGGMSDSAFASPVLTTLNGRQQLLVQTRTRLAGVDPASGDVLWSEAIPAFRGMNILTPTVHQDGIFTSNYQGKSYLFHPKPNEQRFAVATAWTNKAQGYMSSPVVSDGHVYLHLQNQRFTCIDLKSGETRWTTGQSFGRYWSLVAQGDRILALDERGTLYLIRANPEKFELLSQRKVSDAPTWGHLAVCGDEVFIRELNAIVAYRWK